MSLVRNVRAGDTFDVYIGRPSPWGNPFRLGVDGDRATVVRKFREFIMGPHGAKLRERARVELRGKTLGCWCAPLPCHGDVWEEIANT
jgi:hypothetical protein